MSVTEKGTAISSDDEVIEIRLSDVVVFLKKSRRVMLIGALIGALIGGIYAFSKPNEYSSQITVLPEIQTKNSSNLGNLGSLAGLAGIDIGSMASGTDAIRPELYPNVLQSVPFALNLFKKPVYVKEYKRTQPLETYLVEKTKSRLTDLLSFGGSETNDDFATPGDTNQALRMTKEQELLVKALHERITGTYEKKSGVLTITSTMTDPVVAADVVRHSLAYLTDYITTYRTEKARREVDFLGRQVSSAKQRYQAAEYALSAYRDQNRSVFLNTAKIEEQRIQAEFLLAQDLYNTLSKQSEMAKIKVQEDTPVFKVLEPARVPLKKSGPKRSMIILVAGMLGAIVSLVYAFIRRGW
ncbi:GNVR domain-containing protein [Fibrella sp. WM1]|uniref:GNVR domain-containing protein n=1 Tax=Fibrella musci TaxID=3242485 RepID=UPI0035207B5D